MTLSADVERHIRAIAAVAPGILSIWLLGSRANGTARVESDWDFFAFADADTLAQLRSDTRWHRQDMDFLVITNSDDFKSAWGETDKGGSLTEWEWRQETAYRATYTQHKWVDAEDGAGVRLSKKVAIRVWPEVPTRSLTL